MGNYNRLGMGNFLYPLRKQKEEKALHLIFDCTQRTVTSTNRVHKRYDYEGIAIQRECASKQASIKSKQNFDWKSLVQKQPEFKRNRFLLQGKFLNE